MDSTRVPTSIGQVVAVGVSAPPDDGAGVGEVPWLPELQAVRARRAVIPASEVDRIEIGPTGAASASALRLGLARRIPIAFGSDCMPLGPLYGLQGAVEHPLESERLAPAVAWR